MGMLPAELIGAYLKEVYMSILSFPDRGPWGKASWRGNMSGHVYADLFKRLQPKVFIDPMVGSGTSVEVATEMGIRAFGLDLFAGFNVLSDSILEATGEPGDCVVSHPPYGSMIRYSRDVWGNGLTGHPDDLSECIDDEDFHAKLHLAMLNQREATLGGGYYGTIIGDLRSKGRYVSYQAEIIARMPADELAAVIIKVQHNTTSSRRIYSGMALPFIEHAYIVLFKKQQRLVIAVLGRMAKQAHLRLQGTWRNVVKLSLQQLGGKATLKEMYDFVAGNTAMVTEERPNWQAKVRQILNSNPELFVSSQRGVWEIRKAGN